MTCWLNQKECIMQHEKYIHRHLETSLNMPLHVQKPLSSLIPERRLRMAKHPTHQGVPIEVLGTKYGATQFIPALSWFVAQYQHPEYSKAKAKAASNSIHIPFSKLSVFHHVKFISYDAYSLNPLDEIVVDSIHIDPAHVDKYRKFVPGWFNTATIKIKDSSSELDLKGTVFNILLSQLSELLLMLNLRSLHQTGSMHLFIAPSCPWSLVSGWYFFAQTLGLCWMVYTIFSLSEGSKFPVIQGLSSNGSWRALCKYYSCISHSLQHSAVPKIWPSSTGFMVIK